MVTGYTYAKTVQCAQRHAGLCTGQQALPSVLRGLVSWEVNDSLRGGTHENCFDCPWTLLFLSWPILSPRQMLGNGRASGTNLAIF